ncbi:MAG: peptide chain release factor 2 [Bacillota bacterium]
MLKEYLDELEQQKNRFAEMRASLEYDQKLNKLKEIEAKANEPGLWEDGNRAKKYLKKQGELREQIRPLQELEKKIEEAEVYLELADEGAMEEREALKEADPLLQEIIEQLEKMELETLLGGKYDYNNAIVSLNPGAGGLESQDWAEMLLRMYNRWCEQKGYQVELIDLLSDDEAGIKSATIIIRGYAAYGYLQAEKGVHRLIRISPYDTSKRRHTSFASVDVVPEVEDEEYEINEDDLKIDTFRASGAGGQHVNKTDSAVRITHLPTGLIATCQKERSQHNNREQAMKVLQAKLAEITLQEQANEIDAERGQQKEIAWGSQIRTYTFHPFTLVKDHRTGMESGQVDAVMNGMIDPFIDAYLRWKARGKVPLQK